MKDVAPPASPSGDALGAAGNIEDHNHQNQPQLLLPMSLLPENSAALGESVALVLTTESPTNCVKVEDVPAPAAAALPVPLQLDDTYEHSRSKPFAAAADSMVEAPSGLQDQ
jgi:hypothetical protein